jgi:hypothetical protein
LFNIPNRMVLKIFGIFQLFLVLSFMFFLIRLLTVHRRKFQDESWSAKDVKLCATVAILACLFTACTLPLTTVLLCYDYLGVGRRTKRGICVLRKLSFVQYSQQDDVEDIRDFPVQHCMVKHDFA